jgi:hypothetical protein
LRSKFSRSALIAGLALGASGLVAVPADAALTAANNAVTTPTYYVSPPAVGGTSSLTPESATVSGVIDTGGEPEGLLPIPAGGLTWGGGVTISSGVVWADSSSGHNVPLNGIPVSGSNTNVSVTVADAGVNSTNPVTTSVQNAGADNYSTVTFAYDPVSDYQASGNEPGGETLYATGVNVPTTNGVSTTATTIGAFGQAAQTNTGNLPLTPNTQYYYWLVQQAGGTDSATSVNIAQWAQLKTNPTNVCLPNVAIAQDPTLQGYTTTTTPITVDGTSAPASAGPCVYYYGDANGAANYQSPVGEFTTPPLGRLVIARSAKVSGRTGTVAVTDKSGFKASGELELDNNSGDTLATGKFSLAAGKSTNVKLKLTRAGATAAQKHKSGALALTSNFDQPSTTTSIKLLGVKAAASTKKKKK